MNEKLEKIDMILEKYDVSSKNDNVVFEESDKKVIKEFVYFLNSKIMDKK
jgi:hypothetical protein